MADDCIDGYEPREVRVLELSEDGVDIVLNQDRNESQSLLEQALDASKGRNTSVFYKAEDVEADALPVEDSISRQTLDLTVALAVADIYRDVMEVDPLPDPQPENAESEGEQQGGLSRCYIATLPDRKMFIKAILKGHPNEILDECTIHQELHRKLGDKRIVPEFYFGYGVEVKPENDPAGKTRMLPIIGMEPIEGRYLKRHLAANNGATGNNLMKLKVFKDIADAVGEIHKAGYVHRDLKPKNILIEPDEHVRIIDLGITARTGESPKNQYASGTLGYMSPEQHAVMAAHPTMDIYSLGCILYEIVTGKTPLENLEDEVYKRDVDMIEKIDRFIGAKVNDEHLVNPSPRIKRVLDSCNQYIIEILQHTVRGDPSMRYMSCDALSNAVGNIIKKLDHSDRMSRKLNEASLMGRLTRKAHHEPTTPEEQAIDFVMRRKQRGLPNYDQRNAVAYMQQFIDDIMPYLPRINMRMRQLMSESAARKQEYLAYTASLKQESPGTEPR